MRLTEKKSVEKYLQEVRKEFKAGRVLEDLLETSAVESVEEVKKACPDFLKAAVSYIKLAEVKVQQGYIPTQAGLVCDSYEERKQLQRTFTLDDMQKIKVFYPDWWLSGYELFIYHLMEALFDASLMIEQGAERKFRELVTLYRSFKRVEEVDGWYFAIYEKSVLFINTLSGKIFSLKKSRVTKFISDVGIKEINRENEKGDVFYFLVLKDGRKVPLMKNQNLPLAMLTSFLAAAAGAMVWGLMYYQGWFVGYIALLSMLGAGACYLRFYYKLDWKFYVWNILVVVVLNLVASIICDLLIISTLNGVTFGQAFSLYQMLLSDASYRTMYILNIVSNLIFSGFGIGLAVYIFRGKNYARVQIERVDKKKSNYVGGTTVPKEKLQTFNASTIKKAELILNLYVEVFSQFKKDQDKEKLLAGRKEIEEKYVNNLSENEKQDIIKYIATISPGTEEETNAINLMKIKLG